VVGSPSLVSLGRTHGLVTCSDLQGDLAECRNHVAGATARGEDGSAETPRHSIYEISRDHGAAVREATQ